MFSLKFAVYLQEHIFRRTPLDDCFLKLDKLLGHFEHGSKACCRSQFYIKVTSWSPVISQTICPSMTRLTFRYCFTFSFSVHYYYWRAMIWKSQKNSTFQFFFCRLFFCVYSCGCVTAQLFTACCSLKGHTYLNKHRVFSCSVIKVSIVLSDNVEVNTGPKNNYSVYLSTCHWNRSPSHLLYISSTCLDLTFTLKPNIVVESGVHSYLHPNGHKKYYLLNLIWKSIIHHYI